MRLAILLAATPEPPAPAGARRAIARPAPRGYPPEAALLGLLGQDPLACWTGPAPLAAAEVGVELAEDETAYLLAPVRVEAGQVVREVAWTAAQRTDLLERLGEALEGEALALTRGAQPTLLVAEALSGPPTLAAASLVGRPLEALPAGPPALLRRVVERSRAVCAELGGQATHVLPHSPGGPPRVRPLREAWLGIGPAVFAGSSPRSRALALLLRLRHLAAAPGQAAALAAEARADVALVEGVDPPEQVARLAAAADALVAVGAPAADGQVVLAWVGGPPALTALTGRDPLRALLDGSE